MTEDFTLLVKTIMRPVKVIRLLHSVRDLYDFPIIVVDDGPEESHLSLSAMSELGVLYRTYDEDIGIGTCYNDALGRVNTPYTIICDDDNRFTGATAVAKWLPFLDHGIYDLVGGAVRRTRGGQLQSYVGTFEWGQHYHDGYDVHMRRIETRNLQEPLSGAQFVMNWFAARTDFLRANPWDTELKVCRHEDWFMACHWYPPGPGLPKNPVPKIGYHPRVEITHDRDVEPFDESRYLALRSGRFQEHLRMVEAKWGLRKGGLRTP